MSVKAHTILYLIQIGNITSTALKFCLNRPKNLQVVHGCDILNAFAVQREVI